MVMSYNFETKGAWTETAFKAQKDAIDATTQCAKPSPEELMGMLTPIVEVHIYKIKIFSSDSIAST